tara:strand:- start:10 stop:1395 length:1386 start_codon:yes stop_codon:yes gene_type:complete
MSKLKTYKFSDLYEMSSGISSKPEQAGHGSPFVSFSTVFNNQFLPDELPDLMDTSAKEKNTYSIKEGDIFLTRTSETLDELGMSCVAVKDYPEASYSGFLKRLRPTQTNITYPKFMAFYLRSYLFRKTMNNNAIMTLRASLNEQIFSYLDLVLPSYEEQVKIGDLFFKISKKIKVNNKINAELEAMAKLIYDYWFVQFDFPFDFAQGKPDPNGKPYKSSGGRMVYNKELKREIPEGWEVGTFETIATIIGGSTPSKAKSENFTSNRYMSWITPKDLSLNKGNKFITRGEWDVTDLGIKNASLKIMPKETVLLSSRAPIGYLAISREEVTTNQGFKSFVPKENYSTEFIFYCVKNQIPKIEACSSGSTFKEVSASTLKTINISIPDKGVLENYNNISKPIFKKQNLLEQENQKLSELRDWLLPMLMNGQVTVSNEELGITNAEFGNDLGMVAEETQEYKYTK